MDLRPGGPTGSETGFSLYPKFAIPGSGANGGSGIADLSIDYFSKTATGQIPQVVCEVKAVRSALDAEGHRAWAAKYYGDSLEALHEAIGQRLNPGMALDAAFADGELSFLIDGVIVIDHIFESEAEGTFILAQW
jgi:hypothetical protein